MEWDLEDSKKAPGIWCIAAKVTDKAPPAHERRLDLGEFEPGATVYCLPPSRGDREAEVKVVGYGRKFNRLVPATLLAKHLLDWRAEYVADRRVMKAFAPPWDAKEESRMLASMVASWHDGGEWPAAELRDWNRTRAQRVVAGDTWFQKVTGAIKSILPGSK